MRASARSLIYSLLALSLALPALAPAANAERGKTLHEQHCTGCHDSSVYTRPDRQINSLEALKTQVQRCEVSQSLQWFDPDVEDVVAYLNANFYRFGGTASARGGEK